MGLRRNTLLQIKEFLNNKPIELKGKYDFDTIGTGKILHAYTKPVDIGALSVNPKNLPVLSILPQPHSVVVGLNGNMMDSNYRIAMFGFVAHQELEELSLVGEDVIEFIIQTLTNFDNVAIMHQYRFSIIEFGPVLNEFYTDNPCAIGYISVPATVQFVEN